MLAGGNGSGKSTVLHALSGLVPSHGSWTIEGRPAHASMIAFLPQHPGGLDHLSFNDALLYSAALHAVDGSVTELDRLGLPHLYPRRLGDMSGGERHLAYLALVLVRRPEVILLDEPTAGIDVENRIQIRRTIKRLAAERLVITASHLPDDIDALGDRILVLSAGRIVFDGDLERLREMGEADPSDSAGQIESALRHLGPRQ